MARVLVARQLPFHRDRVIDVPSKFVYDLPGPDPTAGSDPSAICPPIKLGQFELNCRRSERTRLRRCVVRVLPLPCRAHALGCPARYRCAVAAVPVAVRGQVDVRSLSNPTRRGVPCVDCGVTRADSRRGAWPSRRRIRKHTTRRCAPVSLASVSASPAGSLSAWRAGPCSLAASQRTIPKAGTSKLRPAIHR